MAHLLPLQVLNLTSINSNVYLYGDNTINGDINLNAYFTSEIQNSNTTSTGDININAYNPAGSSTYAKSVFINS